MKLIWLILGIILIAGCTTDTNEEKSSSVEGLQNQLKENKNIKEFSNEEFTKALENNDKIMLLFSADWCPSCAQEKSDMIAAFEEMPNEDVIIFLVNYKDSRTDYFEEQLAKEYGVPYQHTKIVFVNGEKVSKFPDVWNKERYLEEIPKI